MQNNIQAGADSWIRGSATTLEEIKDKLHKQIVVSASEVGSIVPISIWTTIMDEPLRAVICHGTEFSTLKIFIPASARSRIVEELENNTHFNNGIYLEDDSCEGEASYNAALTSKYWKALSAHLVDISLNLKGFMFGIGDKADFTFTPSSEFLSKLNSKEVN